MTLDALLGALAVLSGCAVVGALLGMAVPW